MNVRGATVLVTGANRGIGAAYARAFLDAGAAKVYGAARDPASVSDADVVAVRMDVTNDTEVAAAAESCPDVSIVVNNAGVGFAVSALSTKVATKGRAMFDTNVFGILNVASAFAPIIEGNGGGALINVLSIGSWRTTSTLALYSASKSAAWSLTNSLRLELKPRGIQVVGVHCGFVDTDLTAGMQMAKIGPANVALATIAGIIAGQREVLVDDISRQIRSELAQDLSVQYPELNAVPSPQPSLGGLPPGPDRWLGDGKATAVLIHAPCGTSYTRRSGARRASARSDRPPPSAPPDVRGAPNSRAIQRRVVRSR
jgi:NAD(P)-dependent dehydrogenase (short-subunit alcohol dehydrogenase family)